MVLPVSSNVSVPKPGPLESGAPPSRRWSHGFFASCAQVAARGWLLEAFLIAGGVGLFVLDLELPRGAAPEFLYAAVVYFSLWSSRKPFPFRVTLGCTALTLLGFFLSPVGAAAWIDLANRFFAVVLMWITLELGLARRDAYQALEESHAVLDERVRRRTGELSQVVASLQRELVQRMQVEGMLAESRERYRMLFDHAPYPMWIVDLETLRFLDVNHAAVTHYGYSRDEFLAMTIKEIRPPEDVPRLLEVLPSAPDSLRMGGTWRHRRKDGSLIEVELGLYSFVAEGRKVRLTVVNDVTEPKRVTEQLKESEERFRRIFDGAPIGMGIVGQDCRFHRVNDAFCEMLGYRPSELIGHTFGAITHPDDLDADLQLANEVLDGKRRSYRIEKRYRRKSGEVVWGHLTVTGLSYREGGPLYALGMIENISDRKRADAIRERLLGQIMVAQEEERRRIARELHDGIGQTLTSLAVGLRSLEEGAIAAAAPQARMLRQLAAGSVEEVRRIARGLRPSVLDDLGLEEALRQYAQDYRQTHGIAADVQVVGVQMDRLSGDMETTLYRIIQEAMTNAARHAAPDTVSVVLHGGPSMLTVVIEDDGRGCDLGDDGLPRSGTGLGIQGMRERAALLNGTVELESVPGKGTSVYVHLPLPQEAS